MVLKQLYGDDETPARNDSPVTTGVPAHRTRLGCWLTPHLPGNGGQPDSKRFAALQQHCRRPTAKVAQQHTHGSACNVTCWRIISTLNPEFDARNGS